MSGSGGGSTTVLRINIRDSPPRAHEAILPRKTSSSSSNSPTNPPIMEDDRLSVSSSASWLSSEGPPKPARLYHEALMSPAGAAAPGGGQPLASTPSYRTTAVISAGRLNGMNSNSSSFSGADLSRSVSVCNLSLVDRASPSPASEVRTITNNYQKLLNRATREIRHLTSEKNRLEQEMEKLLEANIELATESKRLLEEEREWRREREGLMNANQEFVEEVERLYQEEERWRGDRDTWQEERKHLEEQSRADKESWREERQQLEQQLGQLVESVKLLTFDNDRLLQERDVEKAKNSKSSNELRSEYEAELLKLRASVGLLEAAAAKEAEEREGLEQELEALAQELELKSAAIDEKTRKLEQAERRCEGLSAENFETQIENDKIARELDAQKKEETKLRNELTQVKVEREWLVSRGKEKGGGEALEKELDRLREELRLEKEKVLNMTQWKAQLVGKNKELQLENERLLQRAEDLEALMNEEVTDINELISVINNIQGSGNAGIDASVLRRKYMK